MTKLLRNFDWLLTMAPELGEGPLGALERGAVAIEAGRIVSSAGLDIGVDEFHHHFVESHVERSNALHATMRDGTRYLVGPLARYANGSDLLSEHARDTARAAGLGAVERNPFRSILVRMVETTYAFEEAARLARGYREPDVACVPIEPGAGEGHGCTEAPRGLCPPGAVQHQLRRLRDQGGQEKRLKLLPAQLVFDGQYRHLRIVDVEFVGNLRRRATESDSAALGQGPANAGTHASFIENGLLRRRQGLAAHPEP